MNVFDSFSAQSGALVFKQPRVPPRLVIDFYHCPTHYTGWCNKYHNS